MKGFFGFRVNKRGAMITHLRRVITLLLSCVSFFSVAQNATDEQLSSVTKAIAEQKSNVAEVDKKRRQLEQQLKQDELTIAKIAREINRTDQQLVATSNKITQLATEKQRLTERKEQQEQLLAKQIRAAYSAGHHDYLKLVINQEQAASVQRTLTYYQYLNDARIKEIDSFEQTITHLAKVTTEHQESQETLKALKAEQEQQQVELNQSRQTRSQTMIALSQQLLSEQEKLDKLIAEEQNLRQELARLAQQAQASLELNGLAELKRKLSWPVKGRFLNRFGSPKHGPVKWKGVLIAAPVGRDVKAVHNGKVLFSDWLNGYGLVTILDHGDGYMSLYGHNQALLKNVGDRVETGEPIALVGQSGGQSRSGLYFEIRHKGKAVNPRHWCK